MLASAVILAAAGRANASSGYHWAHADEPATIRVVASAPGWEEAIERAAMMWSALPEIDLVVEWSPGDEGARRRCDGIPATVRVCAADYGPTDWLGMATLWPGSGSHILRATVQLNDSYFAPGSASDAIARIHVACQEIGHTLGLGHRRAGAASCMNDRDRLMDPLAWGPDLVDRRTVARLYGHRDGWSMQTGVLPPLASS